MKSEAEVLFEKHLRELGFSYDTEFQFHPTRRWRADFRLWKRDESSGKVLVEIEGAIYSRGRHTRGAGYQADLDKYNHATALGYKVFRFSTTDVLRGRAKAFLAEHLREREAHG